MNFQAVIESKTKYFWFIIEELNLTVLNIKALPKFILKLNFSINKCDKMFIKHFTTDENKIL